MVGMWKLLVLIPLFVLGGCDKPEIVPSDARPVVVSVQYDEMESQDTGATIKWIFKIADGWHLYWDGLNDSGAPPSVDLTLPDGWTADPLHCPKAPIRHISPGGLLDHVYQDILVMYQTIHRGSDAEAEFEARIEWLACKDRCVFGDTLLTSDDAEPWCKYGKLVEEWSYLSPERLNAAWQGNTLSLTLEKATKGFEFLPANDSGPLVDILHDGSSDGPTMTIRFVENDGKYGPARGIIRPGHSGDRGFLIDIPSVPVNETDPGG
jgi:hypothetical protein